MLQMPALKVGVASTMIGKMTQVGNLRQPLVSC